MAARRWWVAMLCVCCTAGAIRVSGQEPDVPQTTAELVEHLVASALRSEREGDANERVRLLDQARLVGPNAPLVNWLSGRVASESDWLRVQDYQADAANDPRIAEYRKLRDAHDGSARSERALARWCGRNNWPDAERFHYARLLAYPDVSEAGKKEALRKLNLIEANGLFFTPEELAEHQAQEKAKQEAFDEWRTKIVEWRKAILLGNDDIRQQALIELRDVNDPKVILAAEASLYDSPELFAAELINLIGKFREFEATEALVRFALLTNSEICLKEAVQQLKPRPIHDYYPGLMVLLKAPVRSEFRLVNTNGVMRYEHVVSQQGPQENVVAKKVTGFHPDDDIRQVNTNTNYGTVIYVRRKKKENFVTRSTSETPINRVQLQQLLMDKTGTLETPVERTGEDFILAIQSYLTALSVERKISLLNNSLVLNNNRVFYLLEETSPKVFPRNPSVWWSWWRGYHETQSYSQAQRPTPTRYLYSHTEYSYKEINPLRVSTSSTSQSLTVFPWSCFVAPARKCKRKPVRKRLKRSAWATAYWLEMSIPANSASKSYTRRRFANPRRSFNSRSMAKRSLPRKDIPSGSRTEAG